MVDVVQHSLGSATGGQAPGREASQGLRERRAGAVSNKFSKGAHFCRTPVFAKTAGKKWICPKCGAVYTCKEIKGRLNWLMTRDGRK
jgi:hypothetical protein